MTQQLLVTGGAGYVGRHLVPRLIAAGFAVTVLDNLSEGHRYAVPARARLVELDLLNSEGLTALFDQNRFDAVIHLAGRCYVGESMLQPERYYEQNIVGTHTLLKAMRSHAVNRILFSSSCATYGVPDQMPITEATQQQPINPYGLSKWMVERMLADYQSAYGLQFTALRFFNVAGAELDGSMGEDHSPETHLIPLVIAAALSGKPVTVMGTDYGTPDGTCIRDYVHVIDLAEAHLAALRALLGGGPTGPYNVGAGVGSSVLEIVRGVERLTGKALPVRYGARRPGDPPVLVSETTRIQRELGWTQRCSDLQTVLSSALAWHRRRLPGS